ncbi:MAG TPA: hypothetical protein VGF97_05325 [Rhizomicrobium sp.]|jgi:hypothetical protein
MRHVLYGAFCVGLFSLQAPSYASVVISSDPTQNISCSAGTCIPSASTATLNVGDLENLLEGGSIVVTTTGSNAEANNIVISAKLSWSTPNALTLLAHHSITIKKRLSVAGQGGLALSYDSGSGDLRFEREGSAQFSSTSSSLQINGVKYILVNTIRKLASAIQANPSGKYALAKNYNAARDGTYALPPIGTTFAGVFEGLGNTISGLTIYDTVQGGIVDVGLFGENGATGIIRDILLTAANVTGTDTAVESEEYLGSLVGYNSGLVVNAFAQSTVTGASESQAGGLVGADGSGGKIASSGAESSVSGEFTSGGLLGSAFQGSLVEDCQTNSIVSNGGGLVGENDGRILASASAGTVANGGGLVGENTGDIENSHSSAEADATQTPYGVGGLVEQNSGTIRKSYATGTVNGSANSATGGLVAVNVGSIADSYATGATNGKGGSYVGGLVGESTGSSGGAISDSYSTGPVTGGGSVGGLVGFSDKTIVQSWSTSPVTGTGASYVGGLDGENRGTIKDCYAFGAVTGPSGGSAGGLIGHDMDVQGAADAVSASYSTGQVTGAPDGALGGSVGIDQSHAGTFGRIYWDTDTSGVTNLSQGAGNIANDPGIAGETTAQLQAALPKGFKPSVWGQDVEINNGLPYLLANPPPPND